MLLLVLTCSFKRFGHNYVIYFLILECFYTVVPQSLRIYSWNCGSQFSCFNLKAWVFLILFEFVYALFFLFLFPWYMLWRDEIYLNNFITVYVVSLLNCQLFSLFQIWLMLSELVWHLQNIPCCSGQCRGNTFLAPAVGWNKCCGLLFNFCFPQCWNYFWCCSKCTGWCIKCFWLVFFILKFWYHAIPTNMILFLTDVWFCCRHNCCFVLDGQKRKEKSPYHKL